MDLSKRMATVLSFVSDFWSLWRAEIIRLLYLMRWSCKCSSLCVGCGMGGKKTGHL